MQSPTLGILPSSFNAKGITVLVRGIIWAHKMPPRDPIRWDSSISKMVSCRPSNTADELCRVSHAEHRSRAPFASVGYDSARPASRIRTRGFPLHFREEYSHLFTPPRTRLVTLSSPCLWKRSIVRGLFFTYRGATSPQAQRAPLGHRHRACNTNGSHG